LKTNQRYVAFWSYTRFDDNNDHSWLSNLKESVETEVRALSGKHVEIFQDVDGILWGEQWRDKLQQSAASAAFLIPIITPSYFTSDACRMELEWFIEREKQTHFHDLILPLYYIPSQKLDDAFQKGSDWLASAISDHNYENIQRYRHRKIESRDARKMVTRLAQNLIERLSGLGLRYLNAPEMGATITLPSDNSRVPNRPAVLGTIYDSNEWVEIWVVVEVGNVYHPQYHIVRSQKTFQSWLFIGRPTAGMDANSKFGVHVLAVTEEVSEGFERYEKDSSKRQQWHGVPRPADSRILASITVTRDDAASPVGFLNGSYDEFRADGTETGGVIRLTTSSSSITTEAKNLKGDIEWIGKLDVQLDSKPIQLDGIFGYRGKADRGHHEVIMLAESGDLTVEGTNVESGGKSFHMIWKKK
jgi:hypothetical protein